MNDKIRIRSIKEIKEDGLKSKSIRIGNDPNLEKLNKLAEEQMQQKRTTTIPWSVIIAVIIIAIIYTIL